MVASSYPLRHGLVKRALIAPLDAARMGDDIVGTDGTQPTRDAGQTRI